jgi:hypothetical protein
MRPAGFCAALAVAAACARVPPSVPLAPEERTTLHVGDVAALYVPSRHAVGSAQSSLVPLRQLEQKDGAVYLYRAVSTGNGTFVLTPDGIPAEQCISCVTRHYFVTVVP